MSTIAGRNWHVSTETLVPLGLVITLAAAIFWSGSIYLQVQHNTKMISEIKSQHNEVDVRIFDQINRERDYLRAINMRLSRIEGKIDEIKPHHIRR